MFQVECIEQSQRKFTSLFNKKLSDMEVIECLRHLEKVGSRKKVAYTNAISAIEDLLRFYNEPNLPELFPWMEALREKFLLVLNR